jgi:hypothetical protein
MIKATVGLDEFGSPAFLNKNRTRQMAQYRDIKAKVARVVFTRTKRECKEVMQSSDSPTDRGR